MHTDHILLILQHLTIILNGASFIQAQGVRMDTMLLRAGN